MNMLNRQASSKVFAKSDNAADLHFANKLENLADKDGGARKSRRLHATANLEESRRGSHSGARACISQEERGIKLCEHDRLTNNRASYNRTAVESVSRRKSCTRHQNFNLNLEGEHGNFDSYFEKSYLSSPGKNYFNVRAEKNLNIFDKEKVPVKMRINVPPPDDGSVFVRQPSTTVVDITPECSIPKVPTKVILTENGENMPNSSDVHIVSCFRAVPAQVAPKEWHLNNIIDNISVNQIIHDHQINEINEINDINEISEMNEGKEGENVNLCVSASQKALQMDTMDLITCLPASSKMKYNSDPITSREQRRRDRRERRQARTRGQLSQSEYSMQSPPATASVIMSDTSFQSPPDLVTLAVTLPPPYTTLPAPLVPSIVSTVPVTEDSRFSFPLNIVRR